MEQLHSGHKPHLRISLRRVTGPMLFPDPNGRVDYFGGFDGQFYQLTMWQWNGSDWTQLFPPTVPFARGSAAVATNTATGQVVMFGGLADVNPINTWTYDGTTWTLQSPRSQPPLVYARLGRFRSITECGRSFRRWKRWRRSGQHMEVVWICFRLEAILQSSAPPPREGHGMAYDPALHHVIVFGGQNNEMPLNDTWEL